MEFKKTLITFSLAAALVPALAQAQQPSYSYLDAGYARLDLDDAGLTPTGFFARGSAALGENWFVKGGFLSADDSNGLIDVEADQYSLGGGYKTGLNDATTLHIAAEYINMDAEAESRFGQRASAEEDGYGLAVGVRSMLSAQFELNGELRYIDSDDASGGELGVGALWHITDQFGLVAEASVDDDSNSLYLLGARLSF